MDNIKRLPDCYRKDENSNNYKLLRINELDRESLRADLKQINDSLDLDTASGRTLDYYGASIGQPRGYLNDGQYLILIKVKLARIMNCGDYNSVLRALKMVFSAESGDIIMQESENPACVKLARFPLQTLVNAGFTSRQVVDIINTILPICVSVDVDEFEGTFEFSETGDEYDTETGFANIEQTIGGYFGLLLGDDDNSKVLPL
ncbi:MAG: hypothetical protein ACI4CT_05355 [Lachnospiraceae bacterium]